MSVYKAFPDFDQPLPVQIPDGFLDTSYGNDVCPSWTNDELCLCLWVDFSDPQKRDFPEMDRFSLQWLPVDGSGGSIVTSNDFAEILLDIERVRCDFATAKDQVIEDVLDGRVHPSVHRFDHLGDYVDSNGYGGFDEDGHPVWEGPYACNEGHLLDRGVAVMNAVHSAVDRWLMHGGIAEALAAKLNINSCYIKHKEVTK